MNIWPLMEKDWVQILVKWDMGSNLDDLRVFEVIMLDSDVMSDLMHQKKSSITSKIPRNLKSPSILLQATPKTSKPHKFTWEFHNTAKKESIKSKKINKRRFLSLMMLIQHTHAVMCERHIHNLPSDVWNAIKGNQK